MSSHVHVNQAALAMGDEQEHVERLEGQGLKGEEVGGPDMGCVVPEEDPPGLRGWAANRLPTVASDGASADLVAQLVEFTDDARAALAGILPSQASN